jgi:hypothetical protein
LFALSMDTFKNRQQAGMHRNDRNASGGRRGRSEAAG